MLQIIQFHKVQSNGAIRSKIVAKTKSAARVVDRQELVQRWVGRACKDFSRSGTFFSPLFPPKSIDSSLGEGNCHSDSVLKALRSSDPTYACVQEVKRSGFRINTGGRVKPDCFFNGSGLGWRSKGEGFMRLNAIFLA